MSRPGWRSPPFPLRPTAATAHTAGPALRLRSVTEKSPRPHILGCFCFSFGVPLHHGCPPSRPRWFAVQILFGDLEQASKYARFDGFAIGFAAGDQDPNLPLARNHSRRVYLDRARCLFPDMSQQRLLQLAASAVERDPDRVRGLLDMDDPIRGMIRQMEVMLTQIAAQRFGRRAFTSYTNSHHSPHEPNLHRPNTGCGLQVRHRVALLESIRARGSIGPVRSAGDWRGDSFLRRGPDQVLIGPGQIRSDPNIHAESVSHRDVVAAERSEDRSPVLWIYIQVPNCKRRRHKLLNLSSRTLVDRLPRVDIGGILTAQSEGIFHAR